MSCSCRWSIFFIWFFCFGSCYLAAQEFVQEDLFSTNQLKASTIYHLTEDQEGFIWIGTNEGLFRFDGMEYKQFTVSEGLGDMEIFNIQIDEQNHIFVSNFSKDANWYYKSKFHQLARDSSIRTTPKPYKEIAYYPFDNAFFLYKQDEILYLKYESGENSFREQIHLDSLSFVSKIESFQDKWYVFFRNEKLESFYHVYEKTKLIDQGKLPAAVSSVKLIDSIAYLTFHGFPNTIFSYRLKPDFTLSALAQYDFDFRIKLLFQFQEKLWFTSYDGGAMIFEDGKVAEHFLPNKSINNILVDSRSNLWLGTEGEGLYFFQKNECLNLDMKQLGLANPVLSLAKGTEEVFMGFNKLTIGALKGKSINNTWDLQANGTGKFRRVLKLAVHNHQVYCGTDDSLFELNPDTETILKIAPDSVMTIKDFVLDQADNLWVGTSGSLWFLKKKNGEWESECIWENRVTALHLDEEETLWIGALDGLYFKEKGSPKIQKFHLEGIEVKKINDLESKAGDLYIATDYGLQILTSNLSQMNWITKDQGLLSNQCRKVFLEKDFLWVSSSEGLARIQFAQEDFEVYEVRTYTTFDGLLSNDVNDLIVGKDTLWIATNEGLSILPRSINPRLDLPKTNIVKASTNLQEHNIFEELQLSPSKNSISISFSGMSFDNADYDTYEYRLLPNARDWTLSTENNITFFELQPGQYTFEVRTVDYKKQRSAMPASLKFEVQAAFVQTGFFKMLLALLTFAILLSVFYWREKEMAKANSFQKIVSSLELEAIKAQINPHFIYNSLNSIKSTVISKELNQAEKQISVFATLVRQTLNVSQKNFIELKEEVQYLERYLEMEKIRFKEFLNYSVKYESIGDVNGIKLPTMLIQPFVENAIKHGVNPDNDFPCQVQVRFRKDGEVLVCEVEDNGPGLKKTKERSAFSDHVPQGMRISSSRGKAYQTLYGMDIQINTEDKEDKEPFNNGTIVNIKIPLNYDQNKDYHY